MSNTRTLEGGAHLAQYPTTSRRKETTGDFRLLLKQIRFIKRTITHKTGKRCVKTYSYRN
jgi:predicted SprT family Zn-dependent metalloprotease